MVIALDANVFVKLFVDEPLSDLAEDVVRRHPLIHAPELARLEVAAAIVRKARNSELSQDEAAAKLRDWREFLQLGNVRLTPDGSVQEAAERLALGLRHPLADCLYLAVAGQNGVPLVTADQPFLDALGGQFPNARHLSSFQN